MASYAVEKPLMEPSRDALGDNVYILDERRRSALAQVDNAKFSPFHVRVCLVAGVGFFTDAYDIFAINIASTMLGYVYGTGQSLTGNQELGLKVATPVGTLCGQLFFGYLADVVGRKRMYGFELMIIIVATFVQALSGNSGAVNIIGVLIFWRVIMGIGIGGDYPLSAIISSEFASKKIRGRMMTAVFSNQGWGQFTAALVGFVITAGYKSAILRETSVTTDSLKTVDAMWRLLIGLGCVPGVIALYFRLTIPETPRFTMDIELNVQQASADIQNALNETHTHFNPDAGIERINAPKASWADFAAHFGQLKNFKELFATCWCWFSFDIAFYGLGLNSTIVLQPTAFGTVPVPTSPLDAYKSFRKICIENLILSAGGLIPGYWASFLLIDKWGRKPIQLMGFIVLTVLFVVMGFGYSTLTSNPKGAPAKALIFLYCLANFFQNFGPNTSTFVIPGEIFPTRYRSTAHGISAASGKLGAIISQVLFIKLKDAGRPSSPNHSVGHILEVLALFMLTGASATLLLPESKGRTLEDLSNEDQKRFRSNVIHDHEDRPSM